MNNLSAKILIIDDKENIRRLLSSSLSDHGYEIETAENGLEGMGKFQDTIFDIVITDVRMPGMNGLEVLEAVKEINPDTCVIVITAFSDMDDAIKAMKSGACDYLRKPFKLNEIRQAVEKALITKNLLIENRLLRREVEEKYSFSQIISKSSIMKNVFDFINSVSNSSSNILITGETGTGKELVARAIHNKSNRKDKPYVIINCAAIPDNLLESELFGYVKGAFTDAVNDKPGTFEEAENGTLFLDEISEMNIMLQAKLLRVLQDGEFSRIGETSSRKANVRVITATNTNLLNEIEQKRFRKDLYYRINVLPVNIPALRERKDDIPLLIRHFINLSCKDNNIELKNFSPEALNILINYRWPGNVRELQNVVERCCLMSNESCINKSDLPVEIITSTSCADYEINNYIQNNDFSLKNTVTQITASVEKEMILRALEKTEGNKEMASKLLDISRRSLFYKLKQYNIS
mgnify:CR=1 FL=1